MNTGDKLYGFTITQIRYIREIGGRLVEMRHDSTGAKLVWADNGDENKLFSVGFKTLPEDNTGVFHILEHSVLCGSDKFPVKEPFVELLKTSMNTFLNAMTYPDKTIYPVSSRIEQDYLNLMEVYLDAVFRPAILHDPNIFYQEGWHIDTNDGEPAYKGVVFNEMKGAMSDVDQLADRTMTKLLFPDTCYGFNSGGDPDAIPDLSYDSYIERYRRFYHPSNAYFYLDGSIPVEKTLEMIDSYLKDSGRLEDLPVIEEQIPAATSAEITYPAGSGDDKPMVCFGRIAGSFEDRDNLLMLSTVLEQLTDTNDSPLKRAVLSSGLAEDMEIYVSDGIAQPYLMMMFRGVSDPECGSAGDAADKLLGIVSEVLQKSMEDGFSRRSLEASANQLDFRFRQYPEPQALYRLNAAFASWLYGGDPALYLATDEAIANLRQMIADGMAEKIAREYMADMTAYTRLILIPDEEHSARLAAKEDETVRKIVDAMGNDDLDALHDLNEKLLKWQQTDDTPEALASIPQLDISDIDPMPELLPTEESDEGGMRVLKHSIMTHGIVHINAYFPVTQLDLEDLPAAALVTELFKDLPTSGHSILELQEDLKMYVGSMSFGFDIMAKDVDKTKCTPCISVKSSVLPAELEHAEDLLVEILTRTSFDDKALIRELLTQIEDDAKRAAMSAGHRLAAFEARSHWSSRDAAAESVNGYTFNQYMHKMSNAADEEIDSFCEFAVRLLKESINRNNAIVSVTSDSDVCLERLSDMLPEGEAMPEGRHYESSLPKRLGLAIPSSVSFAVQSYDLSDMDTRADGSLPVAANIVSLSHLWNVIRVQGGAYGASMSAGRTGGLYCLTYRDPSPARSLDVFKTVPDFMDEFSREAESGDIDGFIISAIAASDPLISPASKGRSADDFYLSGFTDEDRIRFREEMLQTKPEDLAAQKDALCALAQKGTVCVVGPKEVLEGCEGLEILTL